MKPIDLFFPDRPTTRCMPPPIGCGGPAGKFRDARSKTEYEISRLCQKCQDEIFN